MHQPCSSSLSAQTAALHPRSHLGGVWERPRAWQTPGLPSGWLTAPLPTVSPCHQPEPHHGVRLFPVMFWRSQTGIVYKEPAESCKDSPVRCDGIVDCSQRSDELGCGEARGAGGGGSEGSPPGRWVPPTRLLHPRSALRLRQLLASHLLQRREPVAAGVQQRLG